MICNGNWKSELAKNIYGLYCIINEDELKDRDIVKVIGEALIGGARIINLRVKRPGSYLWNDEVFELSKEILKLKTRYDFIYIVNDFVDVAAEIRADGVHVGYEDMPVVDVRERVGDNMIIGYSAHEIQEALVADKKGADYVTFGPASKDPRRPLYPVQGPNKIREAAQVLNIPVVGIGGINRGNVDDVIATGVPSFAINIDQPEGRVVERVKWYVEKFRK